MPLESATFISGLTLTNPVGASDLKSKGDDHIRLLKSVLQATFPNASRASRFPTSPSIKTVNYTVLATDDAALIRADATAGMLTIALPPNADIFTGFTVRVQKVDSSANSITVDGDGVDTINAALTRTLTLQYQAETYMWDGAEWKMVSGGLLGKLEGQLDVNGFTLGDGTLELLAFTEVASAVNHLLVRNAAAGNPPALMGVGDDSDVGIDVITKGEADIRFYTDTNLELLKLVWVANAVNFPQLEPSAAGNAVKLSAHGDSVDIDVDVQTKGAGNILRKGTALPFQVVFEETDTSISLNGTSTFTHNLGAIPKLVQAVLVCTSTDQGFAVGDEVRVEASMWRQETSGGPNTFSGATVYWNATEVKVLFGISAYRVVNGANHADGAVLTLSNWDLTVRAWL